MQPIFDIFAPRPTPSTCFVRISNVSSSTSDGHGIHEGLLTAEKRVMSAVVINLRQEVGGEESIRNACAQMAVPAEAGARGIDARVRSVSECTRVA